MVTGKGARTAKLIIGRPVIAAPMSRRVARTASRAEHQACILCRRPIEIATALVLHGTGAFEHKDEASAGSLGEDADLY
jgi:hypothetical protein